MKKIIQITDIAGAVNLTLSPERERQFALIDQAAKGSLDAAADLAEGYWKGSFGEPSNPEKARKWAQYAAKHGNSKAQQLLDEM